MATARPQVSIGMPVYNGEKYLAQAIESVLGQDFEDIEFVISDNASTDNTESIINSFMKNNHNIIYYKQRNNLGAAFNYNFVFKESTGTYFKWIAHDDKMEPTFVSRCIRVFNEWDDRQRMPAIVHPKALFMNDSGNITGSYANRLHTVSRWPAVRVFMALQGMSMATPIMGLMPRSMMEKTRLIGSFAASDFVFLLEAAMLGPIVEVDEFLALRRLHSDSSRAANITKHEVLKWFDPKASSKLTVRQKLYLEYLRSTLINKNIGPLERMLCFASVICGLPTRRAHVFGGRVKTDIKNRIGRLTT